MNIAIIGSGLTGSLAAISLANAGCRVDLYERLSDDEIINKNRIYTITHSSRKILENIGVWSELVSILVPFQYLSVIDHQSDNNCQFLINDLNKFDQKYSTVGWIAEHRLVMSTILGFISDIDTINKIPTSVIPNTNNYDIILAADGPSSNTKKRLKTPSFNFNYDQVCLTAKVLLRGVKSNEAFGILNPEGLLKVLPLGGDLFQIIFSQSISKANYNIRLSRSSFLDYLSTILPYGIEPDTLIDSPKSFPINIIISYSLFSGKYIYLGEAAHKLHPLGGHDLNLCWRDVECLTKLISTPFLKKNHSLIPITYSLSRSADILSISILTDLLVRYSRTDFKICVLTRRFIFYILKNSTIFRKFILNLMTNGLLPI